MGRKCIVSASIRGPSFDSPPTVIELGEYGVVLLDGITIGSDPRCTIVLNELRPWRLA